uniref:Serine/threonine-protein phosphatase 2A activator n=1 Tax=Meloidogyne floridensis TaxID=298350 RepID=A0A915NHN3_9BILA
MANTEENLNQPKFIKPERAILNIGDVSTWLKSEAHYKYMKFIRQLNNSIRGISTDSSDIFVSENVKKIIEMLDLFQKWIEEYPPEDMGTQRFGNKSYRKWYERLTN